MNYKVSELAEKAGVTKRTIHYYISKGLLLPPEGSGVNSLYNDEHLERLLLIKELQNNYMPLSKIRDYIMENPKAKVKQVQKIIGKESKVKEDLNKKTNDSITNYGEKYIRENVLDIFEIHISEKNYEKYDYIVENVKKYVKKNDGGLIYGKN